MDFRTAFNRLIGNEGGYSNNSVDPGGETMWGVTARVAHSAGYMGDMKALTRERAAQIYKDLYWSPMRCDELPDALAFQAFDAAVNHGPKQATKFLQRAVGVMDDGIFGPATLAAVHGCVPVKAAILLMAQRLDLWTSMPTWGMFGKGWTRRAETDLRFLSEDF